MSHWGKNRERTCELKIYEDKVNLKIQCNVMQYALTHIPSPKNKQQPQKKKKQNKTPN